MTSKHWAAIVVTVILSGFVLAAIERNDQNTPAQIAARAEARCDSEAQKIAAYVMSQQYVKTTLRSPSTAQFGWYGDRNVVRHLGNCEYNVQGYVDAQNGFGAMIRSEFTVRLRETNRETWTVVSVSAK
jgi:hypothetical protein